MGHGTSYRIKKTKEGDRQTDRQTDSRQTLHRLYTLYTDTDTDTEIEHREKSVKWIGKLAT